VRSVLTHQWGPGKRLRRAERSWRRRGRARRRQTANVRQMPKPYRLPRASNDNSAAQILPKSPTDVTHAHFYCSPHHGTSHPRPHTRLTPTPTFPPLRRLPGCKQSRKARPWALEDARDPLQGERETAAMARACTARPLDHLFADARALLPFLRADGRQECRLLSTLRDECTEAMVELI